MSTLGPRADASSSTARARGHLEFFYVAQTLSVALPRRTTPGVCWDETNCRRLGRTPRRMCTALLRRRCGAGGPRPARTRASLAARAGRGVTGVASSAPASSAWTFLGVVGRATARRGFGLGRARLMLPAVGRAVHCAAQRWKGRLCGHVKCASGRSERPSWGIRECGARAWRAQLVCPGASSDRRGLSGSINIDRSGG